jgi:hypothetical protein
MKISVAALFLKKFKSPASKSRALGVKLMYDQWNLRSELYLAKLILHSRKKDVRWRIKLLRYLR